ncbi:MAG: hypothetical protein MI919_38010 [Holophagales bacterium]|nr:hypothetical protein [Holophagales bacterium]
MGRERYYTLMASLPALEPPFEEERPPMSRIRLEQRLRMLEPDDARELSALESVMHFDRLDLGAKDVEILERASQVVASIRSPLLREVAEWRLGLRTVIAALRRRAVGEPAPDRREPWGFEPRKRALERGWNRRDFGLSGALPWVETLADLLDRGDARGLERQLLRLVWRYLSRKAWGHHFDFEAVALYVLRWNLLQRASNRDPAEARSRFDSMRAEGWGGRTLRFEV